MKSCRYDMQHVYSIASYSVIWNQLCKLKLFYSLAMNVYDESIDVCIKWVKRILILVANQSNENLTPNWTK